MFNINTVRHAIMTCHIIEQKMGHCDILRIYHQPVHTKIYAENRYYNMILKRPQLERT